MPFDLGGPHTTGAAPSHPSNHAAAAAIPQRRPIQPARARRPPFTRPLDSGPNPAPVGRGLRTPCLGLGVLPTIPNSYFVFCAKTRHPHLASSIPNRMITANPTPPKRRSVPPPPPPPPARPPTEGATAVDFPKTRQLGGGLSAPRNPLMRALTLRAPPIALPPGRGDRRGAIVPEDQVATRRLPAFGISEMPEFVATAPFVAL